MISFIFEVCPIAGWPAEVSAAADREVRNFFIARFFEQNGTVVADLIDYRRNRAGFPELSAKACIAAPPEKDQLRTCSGREDLT